MAISSLGDPTGTPGRITWSPAAWHAITAQIYELQGQTALAAFHRRLALEAGTNDDVRLAVLAAQAERVRRILQWW